MITKIRFTKMHGLGNDFVVIDSLSQNIQLDSELIRAIANRHQGIGCDQVLLLEAPHESDQDFFYRIFNADGTEVAQCGNGARCIARYAVEQGLTGKNQILVGTISGSLELEITDNKVTVNLGAPIFEAAQIPTKLERHIRNHLFKLQINDKPIIVSALSLGNPHCVLNVPNVEEIDLPSMAAKIQDPEFFPESVNVGISEILARNHIKVRVFERGVGETLACGSGATAAVISGILNEDLSNEVQVDLPGGALMVSWPSVDGPVYLSGPTKRVFDGHFILKKQNVYSATPERL